MRCSRTHCPLVDDRPTDGIRCELVDSTRLLRDTDGECRRRTLDHQGNRAVAALERVMPAISRFPSVSEAAASISGDSVRALAAGYVEYEQFADSAICLHLAADDCDHGVFRCLHCCPHDDQNP